MLPPIDANPGDVFHVSEQRDRFVATYVKSKSNGQLVFEKADKGGRWYCDRTIWIFKRSRGLASLVGDRDEEIEKYVVEPGSFEPMLPNDTKRVRARKKAHGKATIRQYYTMCMDEYDIPASEGPIQDFLREHRDTHTHLFGEETDAKGELIFKAPGASSLIRYVRECGEKYYRPYGYFLSGSGGDRRSGLWDDFVKHLKWMAVEWYWTADAPSFRAVKNWFFGEIAKERDRRLALEVGDAVGDETRLLAPSPGAKGTPVQALGAPAVDISALADGVQIGGSGFASPVESTLQEWIDRKASLANIARREGRTVANRQMEGINHAHVVTFRPLECVVMDHTKIDLHVVVYDENGKIIAETFRPWLIVVMDMHTRMVLAARLSVESPSLHTLYAGLRETLVPKEFLQHLNRGDEYAWSLDNFGKFKRMLVDNDLANIGRSMRSTAASAGLVVSFAPVKTPPYKAVVERFFKTLNISIWHEADGGVPEKPGVSSKDPRATARFTLQQAQAALWNWIITVYHLDGHDELDKIPPAMKWAESFETYTRPMVKDMNVVINSFGRTAIRTMTTSGIDYRKERFFDARMVTAFLDANGYASGNPKGTRRRNNTRSIEVELTEHPTIEAIGVYDPARGHYWEVPNIDPERTGGYEDQVDQRRERNKAVEAFRSKNELDKNKAAHSAGLRKQQPPVVNYAGGKSTIAASQQNEPAAVPNDGRSSGHRSPIHDRTQVVHQRPGAARGGSARSRKPVASDAVSSSRAPRELKKQPNGVATALPTPGDRTIAEVTTASHEIAISSTAADLEAADLLANLATIPDRRRFEVTDQKAFLELMRAELQLSRQ